MMVRPVSIEKDSKRGHFSTLSLEEDSPVSVKEDNSVHSFLKRTVQSILFRKGQLSMLSGQFCPGSIEEESSVQSL